MQLQKQYCYKMDCKQSQPSTAIATKQEGRSISITTQLQRELSQIAFFESVKKENGMMNFTRVALSVNKQRFAQGDELFNIEKGNRQFLYVLEGMIAIYGQPLSQKDAQSLSYQGSKLIALLYKDGYCGNSEVLNGCRITRIVAAQKSLVYQIPLQVMFLSFKGLLDFPELEQQVHFLKKVSLFEESDHHSLEKLIASSQFITLNKGVKLFEQNQPVTHVYVVFSGTFEIVRKMPDNQTTTFHNLQISCVSEYQVLGAEDVMLESKIYSQTVHCQSLKGVLLKITQQKLMNMIHNKGRMIRLCKSRENWKRDRVQLLEKTFVTQFPIESANRKKRIMSSTTFSKKMRPCTEPTQFFQSIEMERCLSRRSHISNKKTEFFRSQEQYLNYKYDEMVRISSASQKMKSVFQLKTKSTEKIRLEKSSKNMSEIMLQKFMNKKHKIQNKMIFDYLKTRPPELVFNPNKQFSVFKPLHVTESSAIRNRKKVNQIIKSKYFKPMAQTASVGL